MVRGSGAVAAFVTVALGVAGCGGASQQATSGPPVVSAPTSALSIDSPTPGVSGAGAPPARVTVEPKPEKTDLVPVAVTPAAAAPPRTAAPLPALVGMDRAGVLRALGRPKMVRRDATAEVMTFIVPECALFVFIYDRPNSAGTVRHVEARPRPGRDAVSEAACVSGVISRNGPGGINPA